jgi:hypothetical protein
MTTGSSLAVEARVLKMSWVILVVCVWLEVVVAVTRVTLNVMTMTIWVI